MTDIDAIRKTKRYERYFDGMREERKGRYVTAIALDAALLAFDAKCEELARERGGWLETARQLEALAVKHDALRAERDAAVREREGLREMLRVYGLHEACCAVERDEACDCGFDAQLAALAPPTEQTRGQSKCNVCGGARVLQAGHADMHLTKPCYACVALAQPSEREETP